jgi:hypothetical protein
VSRSENASRERSGSGRERIAGWTSRLSGVSLPTRPCSGASTRRSSAASGTQSAAAFRCECARLDCNQLVSIAPREYELIRAHPRRFLVLPGHENPKIESLVETHDGYLVVEKRDEAAELADASDPRS